MFHPTQFGMGAGKGKTCKNTFWCLEEDTGRDLGEVAEDEALGDADISGDHMWDIRSLTL